MNNGYFFVIDSEKSVASTSSSGGPFCDRFMLLLD